jgi:hypothetical protein
MPLPFNQTELDAAPATRAMAPPWRSRRVWLSGVLAGVLLCCLCPGLLRAQSTEEFPEYQLKAAFLFNFAKFIQWPETAFGSSNAPLVIGVLGDDPFGPLLRDTVEGKSVNGRKLQIKYFKRDEAPTGCHILFISRSEKENVGPILANLDKKNTLTVADFEGFARRGGMINLLVFGKSVRFEINVEAAARADLKVSSKLGALGIVVKTDMAKGDK